MRSCALFLFGLAVASPSFSQRRVDPAQMYERVYAIVPMTGSGTWNNPDVTGDFCTSRTERLEDRKEPENAEKDVHAGADRSQAAAD